jgi:membrane associated rhomboid family serine protease
VIPLKDENPTRRTAVVTLVLIAINVVVYFGVQPNPQDLAGTADFTYRNAAIPCEVVTGEPLSDVEIATHTCNQQPEGGPHFAGKSVYLAVLISMFLHGSLLHLGGNMLFLWIFGNNVEDRLGRAKYLAFYLVGGFVATMAHIFVQPDSTVPMIGASGAIAAVMGAYLVWYPNVRIHTLFFFIIILFRDIRAKWLLLFWFVTQFLEPFNPNSGVAWMAHVGGFAFGIAFAALVSGIGGARRPVTQGRY